MRMGMGVLPCSLQGIGVLVLSKLSNVRDKVIDTLAVDKISIVFVSCGEGGSSEFGGCSKRWYYTFEEV